MMGLPERALAYKKTGGGEAADRLKLRGFKRLVEGHRRQQGPEAAGQHAFAGARRPDEYGVVEAGRGYLKGAFREGLPLNLGKVSASRGCRPRGFRPGAGFKLSFPGQPGGHLFKGCG